MRNRFDEQLYELNREIIEMGAMCEEAIASVHTPIGVSIKAVTPAEIAVSVAAEISPEADVIPDAGKNDSPVSPQTGNGVLVVLAGVVAACLTAATVATKKLTAKA